MISCCPRQKVKVFHKLCLQLYAFLQQSIGSAAAGIERTGSGCVHGSLSPGWVFFAAARPNPYECVCAFSYGDKGRVPERELASALASTQPTICWAKGWSGNFHPSIQPRPLFPPSQLNPIFCTPCMNCSHTNTSDIVADSLL